MKKETIKCQQLYSKKDILMMSESQIHFGLCMGLIDKLNEMSIIKYSLIPSKDSDDVIAVATINIILP